MRSPIAHALLVASVAASACSGGAGGHRVQQPGEPSHALTSMPQSAVGRIEVRQIEARPRLTLVSRDGDPTPAVVATVATDLGPAGTAALSAVVESRLRAAGVDADTRVDRSAFRVRLMTGDPALVAAFFAALAEAFARPVTPGSPELALAAQRIASLRRNPLDADELAPVAACTGALGAAPGEALPDVTSPAGARDVEAWRKAALHAGRTSIAAVGPTPFCMAVAGALERTASFAPGAPAADAWPASDAAGVYSWTSPSPRKARLSVAVRVGNAHAAVAAATRLGAPDSPLLARLAALPEPWRAAEITGVVRPRGGCVSVVIETEQPSPGATEARAALAAAIVRREIRTELSGPAGPSVASRQILAATDPREAAARASWWALSGSVTGVPERWATALGLGAGADRGGGGGASAASGRTFAAELDRALGAGASGAAERRLTVERGQGELWLLAASPCGVTEEGNYDAGLTALAALTVIQARRRETDVALEPWITADGLGVIAHAPFRDEQETSADLARRVADAAARALTATTLSTEALAVARSAALEHLEQSAGRHAAAMEAFTTSVVPEHPSWLSPFGLWNRVASSGLDAVWLRWQAFSAGPMRVAVLANADSAQAAAAADAVDRWLVPRTGERACRTATSAAGRTGRVDIRLPRGTSLAQAVIGAAIPGPSAAGHEYAELTALALDGSGGLLEGALSPAHLAARASARVIGGSRAAALIIDVRAPADSLGDAVAEVKALLARLGTTGATEAALSRAAALSATREAAARAAPRRRLIDLWTSGQPAASAPARPSLPAWRDWMARSLRESSLVIVEARPE